MALSDNALVAEYLILKGANLNEKLFSNETPLEYAKHCNSQELLNVFEKYLIKEDKKILLDNM